MTPGALIRPVMINEVSGQIVNAAMRVHSILGPGLLERAYQMCLAYELGKRGLNVRTEVPVAVRYDGVEIDLAYRIDLLVEGAVVVEVKAISRLVPLHESQLVSQLRLGDYRVGLLINFHVRQLREGIIRKVNRL